MRPATNELVDPPSALSRFCRHMPVRIIRRLRLGLFKERNGLDVD
jgi:hypothetical protein